MWESQSARNLFGWKRKQRKRTLGIIRSWPELKLNEFAPRIVALNGGARGPWYVITDRRKG